MEQKKLISETIREACGTALEVKGSVLGAILKARFPQLSLREVYGGLRKFIDAECSDWLRFLRKQGGDDVFVVIDGEGSLFAADPTTIWRVFGNPNEAGELIYDPKSSAILLGSKDSQGEEGLAVLPRITHEEQKALIKEFASQALGENEQELIGKIIDSDNYWQFSTGIIKSSKPSRIADFIEFRKSRLLSSLRERLTAAGATEAQAEVASTWVDRQRPTPRSSDSPVAQRRDRQAILNLIAVLSDEELDQLSLPIWTVANVVSRLAR